MTRVFVNNLFVVVVIIIVVVVIVVVVIIIVVVIVVLVVIIFSFVFIENSYCSGRLTQPKLVIWIDVGDCCGLFWIIPDSSAFP